MHPVPAVSGVVFDSKGRVLLIRRGKPPRLGEWSLPGGSMETGESGETSLRREIFEECGIEVDDVSLIADRILLERDSAGRVRYHYKIRVYSCFSAKKDVRAAGDAASAKWVRPDRLNSTEVPLDIQGIIQKALQRCRQRHSRRTAAAQSCAEPCRLPGRSQGHAGRKRGSSNGRSRC
ncbi:NUDIX hydrolase [bacterium]|nr:NUDIX hydrolase [bacterium]